MSTHSLPLLGSAIPCPPGAALLAVSKRSGARWLTVEEWALWLEHWGKLERAFERFDEAARRDDPEAEQLVQQIASVSFFLCDRDQWQQQSAAVLAARQAAARERALVTYGVEPDSSAVLSSDVAAVLDQFLTGERAERAVDRCRVELTQPGIWSDLVATFYYQDAPLAQLRDVDSGGRQFRRGEFVLNVSVLEQEPTGELAALLARFAAYSLRSRHWPALVPASELEKMAQENWKASLSE